MTTPAIHAPRAPRLCLASASPRRRELLGQLGVPYLTTVPAIDETVLAAESPLDYVVRMARAKARSVQPRGAGLPVLAADTSVVLGERIYGKPADAEDGVAMLLQLSGRSHEVLTAVALAAGGEVNHRVSRSEVRFRHLTLAEAIAYWNTGEPRDKAGGYAVQGHGAVFIEHLCGSYSGVMGLPLFETAELLTGAGIGYWLESAASGSVP
jgi:nucleoside triphosphate pyrophosphatase